jgi:protoheme ferro-lyase
MKWLEPSFLGTMERLGHEGVREMLVVPISFVTEHIETLHEINIDGRSDARKWGIERFANDACGGRLGYSLPPCRRSVESLEHSG